MIEKLLNLLSNVKQTSPNSWTASCPLHDDTHPSFVVTNKDGVILLHCFSCHGDIHEMTAAIGLTPSDLFPTDDGLTKPHRRKHFPARDVLHALTKDIHLAEICAHRICNGKALTPHELTLLGKAANRMEVAREYTG